MHSVMIMYPKTEGSRFDMDYYTSKHMPMFAEAIGDTCQGWGVMAPMGDDYHCVAWAMVSDLAAFGAAMKERGGPVMADIVNYTDTQPTMLMGGITGTSG
jgi:uncharacterized protein (TIGR02118 family)